MYLWSLTVTPKSARSATRLCQSQPTALVGEANTVGPSAKDATIVSAKKGMRSSLSMEMLQKITSARFAKEAQKSVKVKATGGTELGSLITTTRQTNSEIGFAILATGT
jgi:hypothetical protein